MKHFNFDDPRVNRASIGFDRLFRVLDAALTTDFQNFPAYDVEKVGEDDFRVTLALAGYSTDTLSIQVADGVLEVKGAKPEEKEGEVRKFLHRGIANRAFERRFHLADHVEVKSASYSNGLLVIDLKREIPEAKKPRKVDISVAA